MPSDNILPYNIDKLLQTTSPTRDGDNNRSLDDTGNQSYSSDIDDQSDDGKSVGTPYVRKYERRNKSEVPDDLRLRVNGRERERMHDLNSALDSLRQVMPYSHGPSVKKISKMSTLVLARNYIVMLTKSLEEMRKLVGELSTKQNANDHIAAHRSYAAPSLAAHAGVPSGHIPMTTAHLHNMNVRPVGDLHTQITAYPQMHSMLTLPLRMASLAHHTPPSVDNGSAVNVNIPCPCNFCQTSPTSLPKPEWKTSC